MLHPMMPPPMMTTRVALGTLMPIDLPRLSAGSHGYPADDTF